MTEFTTPHTAATGGTILASDHNTRIRDNLTHLKEATDESAQNNSGVSLAYGDVVVFATTADRQVTRTTTVADNRPVAVVSATSIASGATDRVFRTLGPVQVRVIGTVVRGDYLQTSGSAGYAQASGTVISGTARAFGRAVSTGGSAGLVYAELVPAAAESSTGHTIAEGGNPLTQRATLTFDDGLVASDLGGTATAVNASYGTAVPVAAQTTGTAGTAVSLSRSDHRHPFGLGELIGQLTYDPAGDGSVSTTSTAFVDADATNLVVSFVAPASGNVWIMLNGIGQNTSASEDVYWALRESTTDLTDTDGLCTTGSTRIRFSHFCKRTGLTPGTTYTYKWAHKTSNASGTTFLRLGTTYGPASMLVWSA